MRNCMKVILAMLLLGGGTVALAQPAGDPDLQTQVKAMNTLIQNQQKRLAELEDRLAEKQLRKISREETLAVLKEMNADAAGRSSLPDWMDNLKFYGDLRLRYEGDCRSTHDGYERKTRNRGRFRLRFGIRKYWLDKQLEVGFRLASGTDNAATSTNETFDGLWSEKSIWIDRAYATYKPDWLKGFMITGGKIKNPFHTSTLFIDTDVNPEGVYAQYKVPGLGAVEPFVGAGYFVVEETNQAADNAYDTIMVGYAAGATWKIARDVKWTVVGNVWDYDHYDTSGAGAMGNTGNAIDTWLWDFLILNLHTNVDFKLANLPTSVYFDWAHNCKEDESTAQICGQDNAFHAGVRVGKNKKKGNWSAAYEYARIEANSLPGAFTDGSFAAGVTGHRGHVFKAKYNVTDFLTAGVTLFLSEPIRSTDGQDDTTIVQADLVWKF